METFPAVITYEKALRLGDGMTLPNLAVRGESAVGLLLLGVRL